MSTIYTLPKVRSGSSSPEQSSMRDEIERAIKGTEKPTIPGSREEDKKWGFKRSVPTLVLYDEQGLRLYDQITANASEYYPFPDELALLKNHGAEIARSMGFPGKHNVPETEEEDKREREREQRELFDGEMAPMKPWKPAKWGDAALGKWNGGVNGEEGLGGGWERGYDVVELGAGALRKTAHLLTALSSTLPNPPSNASSLPAPITFHPLDLSRPELHRVLGEMDEAFGDKLEGKVSCVGLHGDYEAGLQFIREGKLDSLRSPSTAASEEDQPRGRGLQLANTGRDESISTQASTPSIPVPVPEVKVLSDSPSLSPSSAHILTPGSEASPLPSALTESDYSEMTGCGNRDDSESPHTWSPIDSDASPSPLPSHRKNPRNISPDTPSSRPLHMVFLGSSLGNFERDSAAPFLKSLPLRSGDTLLLGLDGRPAPGKEGRRKVEIAYNDPAGYTKAFEEHGWDVVRAELGLEGDKGVEFVGRYNEELGRHEAYFRSLEDQTIHLPNLDEDVKLEKDELLNIEWSYKYSLHEALDLFSQSDLRVINTWKAPDSEYRLWLLERPHVRFIKSPTAEMTVLSDGSPHVEGEGGKLDKKSVPKWEEWIGLWKLWDHITLDMIPEKMLHSKPIDLRHICLFYLGHIPTFLDIHLTRMTKGYHTEPEYFKTIFERGIDPDVDDPTKCHDHSEVPMTEEDWPALDEILSFRDRVRARLRGIYDHIATDQMELSRHVARVLFMTYEHEAMHAETLLYMLAQSSSTRPPTTVALPHWEALAESWAEDVNDNKVLLIEGGEVKMGHDDFEEDDQKFPTAFSWNDHELGWDIEAPQVVKHIKSFKVDSLAITNNAYLSYLQSTDKLSKLTEKTAPASWIKNSNNEWNIKTLYGPLSFDVAGNWTLMASKDEIEGYCRWKGGRLPTESELRRLWEHPDGPRAAGEGANIGVKNWHPVAPTATHTDNAGNVIHGHNGGVWEWTDTPLTGLDGFVASELYPGYSADFFDGKHFVVLGGSFATVPRIAERQSFRNWYQANYKYSFIGGRVAYDI